MSADFIGLGPVRECACGSNVFKILCSWDEDNTIAGYSVEMYCQECDAKFDCPMPGVNC